MDNAVRSRDLRLRKRALLMLDVWASLTYHRRAGGEGNPSQQECLEILSDVPIWQAGALRSVADKLCDSSDQIYDASPKKYACAGSRYIGKDINTQAIYLSVSAALQEIKAPPVLVDLLLHAHPQQGRYQPKHVADHYAEFDRYASTRSPSTTRDRRVRPSLFRSFRPQPWLDSLAGYWVRDYIERRSVDDQAQKNRALCVTERAERALDEIFECLYLDFLRIIKASLPRGDGF